MPATVHPMSSFNPAASFTRDAATPALPRPTAAPGSSRLGTLSERDLMADLEPHWAAAIDAATD